MSNANQKIIRTLPQVFSRQDLLKEVIKQGYSLSKANQILEYGCLIGQLERVGRGKYRKTDPKKVAARELHGLGFSNDFIADRLGIPESLVGKYLKDLEEQK